MSLYLVPAFRAYALAATFVACHLLGLAMLIGNTRYRRGSTVNEEDVSAWDYKHTVVDHADVQRVKRAHMNQLENILPFLVIGALYAATGPSRIGAYGYYGTFVGARILHTFGYLTRRPFIRLWSYITGTLVTLAMSVHVIVAALLT
jgi:glutathione S-transferase